MVHFCNSIANVQAWMVWLVNRLIMRNIYIYDIEISYCHLYIQKLFIAYFLSIHILPDWIVCVLP